MVLSQSLGDLCFNYKKPLFDIRRVDYRYFKMAIFVRYLRPNPGVDKTRNTERAGTSRKMKKIKIFFYEKKL